MIRFKTEEGSTWTIDDYYSEIGGPERIQLAEKWVAQTVNALKAKNVSGFVDVVVVVNSHKPVNPLNNASLRHIYEAINQKLAPEKCNAVKEFSARNFLVPPSQIPTVEVLIYEESDK